MDDLLIVIPAIKKNAVIPDQLIKKLDGITLIQRAIDIAREITNNIFIITDSEEISLIAQRSSIPFFIDYKMELDSNSILDKVNNIIKDRKEDHILLYRGNTPLIDSKLLGRAYSKFLEDCNSILVSVKNLDKQLLECRDNVIYKVDSNYLKELKAFYIYSKNTVNKINNYKPYIIDEDKSIEIESYQDWWVCEKVLQRKRIIFNVAGSIKIGMGHIYHSLALAHEITDHEVIFICDEQYEIAVEKIAAMDYKVISTKDTLQTILQLKPDLVINDILNTEINYIKALKENNIRVVNFEDLGSGSKYADIVFNELYDKPLISGENYFWGYKYLALRDEFDNAKSHMFVEDIKEIMIIFGGTDQNNLTLVSLKSILQICYEKNIKINIVCGAGYKYKYELERYLLECKYKNIESIYESGSISEIMEKSQLAISSNGRTVYELADMNIPSIIISHHEREATHSFATLEKGFVNLGIFNEESSFKIREKFEKLIKDRDYRELLFMNIKKYSFRKNKAKVVQKIIKLLDS